MVPRNSRLSHHDRVRHLSDKELATLHHQGVQKEMLIVVDQLEAEVAVPYLEEMVVKERFVGHLVVELPVVQVAVVLPQPSKHMENILVEAEHHTGEA